MLNLTVLLRHNENGKRVCDLIGEISLTRNPKQYLGSKTTHVFNTKYSKQRNLITSLFLKNISLKEIFKELEANGMKCVEPKFAYTEERQIVILIDD